jgi:hypothetical protein
MLLGRGAGRLRLRSDDSALSGNEGDAEQKDCQAPQKGARDTCTAGRLVYRFHHWGNTTKTGRSLTRIMQRHFNIVTCSYVEDRLILIQFV